MIILTSGINYLSSLAHKTLTFVISIKSHILLEKVSIYTPCLSNTKQIV